jgi:FlaG/FlaF family flagellin (archaellin)
MELLPQTFLKEEIMKKIALILTMTLSQTLFASTFNEVLSVIKDQGYVPQSSEEISEFNVYKTGMLPRYEVNTSTIFPKGSDQLKRDAKRTVTKSDDYLSRLPKLLHANGVCITGQWQATESSKYTGLFSKGSTGLFVGRVSVTLSGTQYSENRGFGIAGKIFPTMDKNENVKTANFFSIEVLLGLKKQYFMNAAMTNEPETGFDFSLIGMGLKIASAFSFADNNPGFRPLYPISESNLLQNQTAVTPHWFRLKAANNQIINNETDFRNEVAKAIFDNKHLIINVEVSDQSNDRNNNSVWKKIGILDIDESIVSYGCDRRLHFPHPKIK